MYLLSFSLSLFGFIRFLSLSPPPSLILPYIPFISPILLRTLFPINYPVKRGPLSETESLSQNFSESSSKQDKGEKKIAYGSITQDVPEIAGLNES